MAQLELSNTFIYTFPNWNSSKIFSTIGLFGTVLMPSSTHGTIRTILLFDSILVKQIVLCLLPYMDQLEEFQ